MDVEPTLSRFTLTAVLGQGQFGTVRLAEEKSTGDMVAIKLIPKASTDPQRLEEEIRNHSSVCHEHVLRLLEVIETQELHALVLEHAGGGDLFNLIVHHGRVPEEKARSVFAQLTDAVAHLHERGIAHRDLKPENILLDTNSQVKLADFGLSARMRDGELLQESVGSLSYAAPELLISNCAYDGQKVDAWSCGVVLYAMLAGRVPFDADAIPKLFKRIQRGKYVMPSFFGSEAADVVRKLLVVDVAQRFFISEIQHHVWLLRACDAAPGEPSLEASQAPVQHGSQQQEAETRCVESTPKKSRSPSRSRSQRAFFTPGTSRKLEESKAS